MTPIEQTPGRQDSKRWLTPGVLGIGLASLCSDWGHEAATAILPAFVASLGAPAYALGVIEGVSDGLSSFAKLAGGWIADRPELRKPTGVIGYLLTGLSTGAYALANTWPTVLIIRALGWTARGSRGASRDVLLTDSVAPGQEGRAFGYERAMDTTGAVLGPLCATALVAKIGPRGVFMWSLVPGIFAALAFLILVPHGRRDDSHKAPSFISSFSQLPGEYWKYLAGVFAHTAVEREPQASPVVVGRRGRHQGAIAQRIDRLEAPMPPRVGRQVEHSLPGIDVEAPCEHRELRQRVPLPGVEQLPGRIDRRP